MAGIEFRFIYLDFIAFFSCFYGYFEIQRNTNP